MLTHRKVVILLAAAALTLAGCKKAPEGAPESQKPVITLSYANFAPASTFVCVQMEHWKEQLEEKTGGAVKVETYPGGTLLGAKEMFDGVVSGQADIGCLCMAYQPGRFVTTNALGLPLGIPSAKVGSKMLMELYKQSDPEAFKDVKVITMFTNAPSNVMSSKPVRTLADMTGIKLRASGGAMAIIKAWGAEGIGMPMSDVPEALQKGTIDGLFSSLEAMKDFNYAADCKFVTMTDTVVYPFAVVMNKDTWNGLDEEVKAAIDSLVDYQSDWTAEYMDNHVAESVQWATQSQGVEVIELTPVEKLALDELTKPITAAWIEANQSDSLDAAAIVAGLKEKL